MIEIIFVGRSNVGKSTLFSKLFGVRVRRGKRPGTTLRPNTFKFRDLLVTDLPGFGYVAGVSREFNETLKDFVIRYVEENAGRIVLAIHVIDGKAFLDIVRRWEKRNAVPVDVEMFEFLSEFDFNVFVAVNKMDKVEDWDETLNAIAERLGMPPPWYIWRHVIYPISAKRGKVENLREAIKGVLMKLGRYDLIPAIKRHF